MIEHELQVLLKARDEVSGVMHNVADEGGKAASFLEKHWLKVTAAGVALGAGIEAMARKQAPLTEQTRKVAASLNMTEKETRDLALSMSNVTFPLENVLDLMETGRQQGIKSAEQLKEYVEFWDMVDDATGEAGPALAEASAGLRAVGIDAGQEKQALAAFGYITQETTGDIGEFLYFIERTGPELREMDMGVNEAAAIMGVLEHELGMTARTARMEFRQAVNAAEGDMSVLMETLGLTEDQLVSYMGKVEESSGIIERNADIHEQSYTLMQRMQHRLSELAYEYAGFFEIASAITPILIMMGPAIKAISMAKGVLIGLTKAHTAASIKEAVALKAAAIAKAIATAKQWLLNAAMTANPIGIIIVAIGALVAAIVWMIKNWDIVVEHLKKIWEWMKNAWQSVVDFFRNTFEAVANFFQKIWDRITGAFKDAWDGLVNIVKTAVNFILGIVNSMIGGFEGALNFVIKGINAFIRGMNWPIEQLNRLPGVKLPLIPTVGEITLPRIPLMDVGGVIKGPGLFAVGPGVKEIIREPGASVVINMYDTVIREEADIDKLAISLERKMRLRHA